MVTHPDLELYVTWAALEENLKGIRESLDSAIQSPKKDETGKNLLAQKDHVSLKEPEQRYTQTVIVLIIILKKYSFFYFIIPNGVLLFIFI
jgi:hypothetical protein